MAERYEKVKQFTAITTAILLSTSLLTGCGASTQTTASDSVQTATEQAAEEPTELVDPLDWTPLAELDTHADLRSSFEELTNILVTKDGIKSGILYTDSMDHSSATNQNNTLFEVYRNTGFNISAYKKKEIISKMKIRQRRSKRSQERNIQTLRTERKQQQS